MNSFIYIKFSLIKFITIEAASQRFSYNIIYWRRSAQQSAVRAKMISARFFIPSCVHIKKTNRLLAHPWSIKAYCVCVNIEWNNQYANVMSIEMCLVWSAPQTNCVCFIGKFTLYTNISGCSPAFSTEENIKFFIQEHFYRPRKRNIQNLK